MSPSAAHPVAGPAVRLALVEDEPVLRTELAFQLGHQGFSVAAFECAAQLYRHLAVAPVGIALLDIGLDGEDGLSICRHLRAHDPSFGIVFLTARGLRDERLAGLEAGADAYLVKPVDLDELVLVLRRLAARATAPAAAPSDWRLELERGLLYTPTGAEVRLSIAEIHVMAALLRHVGGVCTHVTLAQALGLLPEEYDRHRAEVILSRLRARVRRDTNLALPVVAVRGQGYRFVP